MMIENIKHLDKSKCFFRAQKGVKIWKIGKQDLEKNTTN